MPDALIEFVARYWLGLLSTLVLLQALSTGLAILSERRSPAATLAWLLTVTFLPVVGILGYYLLARTRFYRHYRTRTQANQQADEALSMYVEARSADFDERLLRDLRRPQQGLIALAANSAQFRSGGPPFGGNSVELYFEPERKYEALREAIRSATDHIHLEYYIFRNDRAGTEFRDLLAARAKEGVEVRVLYDGIGSIHTHHSYFFSPLTAAGGRVAAFLPPRFWRIIERVNFRNHRKIAVIDGRTGFVGGMNIGDEHVGRNRRIGRWDDAHVRVEGPAVAELQRIFLTDWLFTTNECPAGARCFPEVPRGGDELVQIVSSGPDCAWPTIQQLYFQAIATAANSVFIATPYFVPDPSMLAALQTAALRGVDVRILVPSKSDARVVTSAARSYYEHLLEAGVRIFEFAAGFIHAKYITADGRYGCVGSANMDVRSFLLNFETSAFVHSERFAKELERHFEREMTGANEIELEAFRRRPRVHKLGQSVARLLSGVL